VRAFQDPFLAALAAHAAANFLMNAFPSGIM